MKGYFMRLDNYPFDGWDYIELAESWNLFTSTYDINFNIIKLIDSKVISILVIHMSRIRGGGFAKRITYNLFIL